VISTKSGHLFERGLVEKYIDNTGKCPVTGEALSKADLQDVKTSSSVKPRPVMATSIPGMLSLFQNEWDALMLETFTLKQHLETVRQELSHALYQHDAACRVIARLIKERDSARASLANAQADISASAAAPAGGMDVEEEGITKDIIKKMTAVSTKLSKGRKKRAVPEGHATQEQIAGYGEKSSHPIHGASKPGILTVSVDAKDPNTVVTGGADGAAMVFNRASGKVTATLSGHKKKINQVVAHPSKDLVFTASADKTARVWSKTGGDFATACQVTCHKDEVSGLTCHATGDYFVTSSLDSTWAFHDIAAGKCLVQKHDAEIKKGFTSATFHPDGLILATGTSDARIRIWDIKAQQNVATFDGHDAGVQAIAFSENGYYMASGDGAAIKLWDLRKLKNFQTVELPATAVQFDGSAQFLAAGHGKEISVLHAKTWEVVANYKGHTGAVTDVAWSPSADYLASTSMDRSLKFFC
jgi:pre-mRNA-processing factor 19